MHVHRNPSIYCSLFYGLLRKYTENTVIVSLLNPNKLYVLTHEATLLCILLENYEQYNPICTRNMYQHA